MNLDKIAADLAEQFGNAEPDPAEAWEKFFSAVGKIGIGGFGTVVVVGIGALLYTIITKLIVSGSQPLFGLFLAMFLLFAALTLAYVIFNEGMKEKRAARKDRAIQEIKAPDTARLLADPIDEPIPSIIEHTTDLLPVENRTRKL